MRNDAEIGVAQVRDPHIPSAPPIEEIEAEEINNVIMYSERGAMPPPPPTYFELYGVTVTGRDRATSVHW